MATQRKRQSPFRAATNGSVAYDVPRGNAVYEPQREERQERVPESKPQKRSRSRTQVPLRKQQGISVAAVAGFVLVAMLAVGVLTSHVQLNSIYADTVAAQSTLTELKSTYAKLETEDEEIFDSETLRKAAEEAGLSKPSASQQVYLELSDPDSTVVYQQKEEASGLLGCWNAVKSFFGGIGAYFT